MTEFAISPEEVKLRIVLGLTSGNLYDQHVISHCLCGECFRLREKAQAILAERERCAKLVEGMGRNDSTEEWLKQIAACIRKG